jgi:hypothetical protein
MSLERIEPSSDRRNTDHVQDHHVNDHACNFQKFAYHQVPSSKGGLSRICHCIRIECDPGVRVVTPLYTVPAPEFAFASSLAIM